MGAAAAPIAKAAAPVVLSAFGAQAQGNKAGTEGGVPDEFQQLLKLQTGILGGAAEKGQEFDQALPLDKLLANPAALQSLLSLQTQGNIQAGQAGQAGLGSFTQGLGGLNTAIQEGFTGDVESLVSNLTGQFESAIRPTADRAFEVGQADVFESAARSGTSRSSTTTDQIARLSTDINNSVLAQTGQVGAGLTNILAPLQAQGKQAATLAAAGLGPSSQGLFNLPVQQNIETLFRGLQLPLQGLAATQQPPTIAPEQSTFGDNLSAAGPLLGGIGGALGKGGGGGGGGKGGK